MRRLPVHRWDLSPQEAIAVQQRLRHAVEATDRLGALRHVAGVDVAFPDRGRHTRCAVALLRLPELALVDCAVVTQPTRFPYVPGLLSFREIPAVLAALERLVRLPDLIVCDAHGLAHPRRFGLACHLGVLLDRPVIGCAKSRLVGDHEEPGIERGSWAPLVDAGETVGAVVRTRTGVRPVYVSVGHRVSLPTAIELTLRLTPRYRLPETTRWADRLAGGRIARGVA